MSETVKIAVRERPLILGENHDDEQCLHIPSNSSQIIIADGRPFAFDHIFEADTTQESVYLSLIQPMVYKLLEGYNATALAYGQTGTGKTYTMGLQVDQADDERAGMLLRTVKDIFQKLSVEDTNLSYEIFISFIEIYNEKAYDLISGTPDAINVKGQKFVGGSKELVLNVEQARSIVMLGNKNRHVRPTKMNANSSRSHAIFTVYASIKRANGPHTISSLNIVDLAGSEGIRRTGHQGLALAEGVNINQGLLSIGKVLQALSTGNKVIPYRDSFLTTVLQSSLNSNSFLTLLACISPLAMDISETLSTLRFAQNAKSLKYNPQINSITADCMKTIAAKTPRKSLSGQPLRQKNSFATPAARKRTKTNEGFGLSTIKKPGQAVHSNTFCTPSKLRKVELFQPNTTDYGFLSPGKKRLPAVPDMVQRNTIPIDDLAELQYFNQDMPPVVRDSIDSRSSILSLNVSSSTTIDVPPQQIAYSPIVKRCMAEFEATIDDKLKKMFENLQNVTFQNLNNTMQQQHQQQSLRTVEVPVVEADSSSAVPPWDTMKSELQKIVRTELTTIMTANAVSERQQATFKRPGSLPMTSTVRKDYPFTKRTSTIHPVVFDEAAFAPRRTINLSCLTEESILDTAGNQTVVIKYDDDAMPPPPVELVRRSVRASKRFSQAVNPADRRRSCRISINQAREVVKKNVVPEAPAVKPKIRGQNKVLAEYFHINQSMEQAGNTKVSKKTHKDAVLKLLNTGSIKELQILPTVGLKTAYQLITHRTLNGKFKNFDEVSKVTWRGNGWTRFQQENNLI